MCYFSIGLVWTIVSVSTIHFKLVNVAHHKTWRKVYTLPLIVTCIAIYCFVRLTPSSVVDVIIFLQY